MQYTVERAYSHKKFGAIGKVRLEVEATSVTLDGTALPPKSVEYLLTFALQSLQDAYAGSETTDEAIADFGKKYEKLIAGEIGTRSGGGVSDEVRVARRIMRGLFKAKAPKTIWEAFLALEEAEQTAKIDQLVAKNAAAITPLVKEELERLAKERAQKAKLGNSVTIDL